ncbi:MAG: lipid-A-disaccharide synthase [Cytophagales bacterium]|nr:MAG: lipid-A-disaccharide synthase [Cytophagales bacterium]
MKYYLIAGERSGDMHAANLMKEIQKKDPKAQFRFWGGDAMSQIAGEPVVHYQKMAFMGITEVIKNLRTIFRLIAQCKKDLLQYQPDVVILIDYAGFNLRIAKFAKKNNIKTFFYISPKIWAWNTKRAYKIKKIIDKMFVIFPFEVDFYQQFNYKVDYVGNPLLDAIAQFQPNPQFREKYQLNPQPIIALLPGSRKQELHHMLPKMLEVSQQFPDYQCIVAGVRNLPETLYQNLQLYPQVRIIYDDTYNLLANAEAAIVTSGTATLETALFQIPQVVVYQTNPLSFSIGIRLVKIKHFSLANLVAQKEIVKELIQNNFTVKNTTQALKNILKGNSEREKMLQDYQELLSKIGEVGASERTATLMLKYLNE